MIKKYIAFKSKNKFRARSCNGFPSKLEASVYEVLLKRQLSGEIRDIKRQQVVDLGFTINWKIDFSFVNCYSGETIFAEAKGISTDDFKLKLKLYRHGQGKCALEIWKGTYLRPFLAETIYPKKLEK